MRIMNRMAPNDGEIKHVSDTALLVAACRAHETALDDAFVRDPFAARLAGERGFAILEALPHANVARFGLAIRTRFVDELLLEALREYPITTVLSVGCGLDTRPWRLDLERNLRWIEIDFADVLDYKDSLMSNETPRCCRERLTIDLNDPLQRRNMYQVAGSAMALMITEGVLMYLPAATVEALAAESSGECGIRHWISDVTTSAFSKVLGGGTDTMQSLRHVQACDAMNGEQILDVVHRHGWTTSSQRSYITDVGFIRERIRRTMGDAAPAPLPFPSGDPTGVHCFLHG